MLLFLVIYNRKFRVSVFLDCLLDKRYNLKTSLEHFANFINHQLIN